VIEADVLVVGAGPAGATAALNLAPLRRVAVLHRPAPPDRIGESLAPAARRLFAAMGLWDDFIAQGHAPCHANRAIWGGPVPFETDFLRDPDGHGWHLDRAGFEAWLIAAAVGRGAAFHAVPGIDSVRRENGRWLVEAGGLTVSAGFVVEAGGRAAPFARRLGIGHRADDRLVCAWIRGTMAQPDAGVTFIQSEAGGWWYTAPLPGGRRVLAFHTDSDLLDEPMAHVPAGVGAVLDRCGFSADGAMAVVPANSRRLTADGGDGWLAAGDAAMSFDPLSAQGIFNALYSGLAAAEAADRWLSGDANGVAETVRVLDGVYAVYRRNLAHWYETERRFGGAAFWRRRYGQQAD
jgi:flavin-dependent dehydrogenase